MKSRLCNYSDTYILLTGDISVMSGGANTAVAFKNCAPLITCKAHINNVFVDTAEKLDIAMPVYNLIE